MTIVREEIFGPVKGVMPTKYIDEALRIASGSRYGLRATVLTRDRDRALLMADLRPFGTDSVDAFSAEDIKIPLGGCRRSSSLSRDNASKAMVHSFQTETSCISRGGT